MPKQASLSRLPKGYKQTIVKDGDRTVVIRLTRDYDKNKKRIARTYILGDDGDTLQYSGYFTPGKRDTKSIFGTHQDASKPGRNKAIRNIASKAVATDRSKPVKLDARKKAAPKKQPGDFFDYAPAFDSGTEDIFTVSEYDKEGTIWPLSNDKITDDDAWDMLDVQEGEWSRKSLADLFNGADDDDLTSEQIAKINWMFYAFSDLKARGKLDGSTPSHDSLIVRLVRYTTDILSMDDVMAIQEYAKRLTAIEFNVVWDATLDEMDMENESVFKYSLDDLESAFAQDARFFHQLSVNLRQAVQEKLDIIYGNGVYDIQEP